MDSNVIVGPLVLLAIAMELFAAPPAQPPRPQAALTKAAAIVARMQTRNEIADRPCMVGKAISLKSINV